MANSYNSNPVLLTTAMPGASITGITVSGGVATASTSTTPTANQLVSLSGFAATAYNNLFQVLTVVTNVSFTFVAPSGAGTASTGTWSLGWRGAQTLNTGFQPSTAQQISGPVTRQWGINVTKIIWTGMTAQGHTFSITDPRDGTVLEQGVAGAELVDQVYDYTGRMGQWRDFWLGQISSGTLLIHYRD